MQELHVNKGSIKALANVGVNTLEELCKMTYGELKAVKGIGTVALIEIMRELEELGLKLEE